MPVYRIVDRWTAERRKQGVSEQEIILTSGVNLVHHETGRCTEALSTDLRRDSSSFHLGK